MIYKDLETSHRQISVGEYQDADEFIVKIRKENVAYVEGLCHDLQDYENVLL